MCFSANVSFITAGGLSIIGLLSMYLAKNRAEHCMAATPFLFAIQQTLEGILWLTLPTHPTLAVIPTYFYEFFAFMVWPLWIPFAISLYEKEFWRKMVIYACVAVGACLALYFFKVLLVDGVRATIVQHHIVYTLGTNFSVPKNLFLNLLYFIAVVAPFFISSTKNMWLFGAALCISYVIAQIFYHLFFASIWCFFAAILSLLIVYIIYSNHHSQKS